MDTWPQIPLICLYKALSNCFSSEPGWTRLCWGLQSRRHHVVSSMKWRCQASGANWPSAEVLDFPIRFLTGADVPPAGCGVIRSHLRGFAGSKKSDVVQIHEKVGPRLGQHTSTSTATLSTTWFVVITCCRSHDQVCSQPKKFWTDTFWQGRLQSASEHLWFEL